MGAGLGCLRAVTSTFGRGTVGIAMALIACGGSALARDDGGVGSFFRDEAAHRPEPVAAEPVSTPQTFAPLTIKRAPSRNAFRNRFDGGERRVAAIPSRDRAGLIEPPPKISIFQDRTLRRGDVVMLKQGLRVFAGSKQFPYTDDDFVALDNARGLNKQNRIELSEIARNQEPH